MVAERRLPGRFNQPPQVRVIGGRRDRQDADSRAVGRTGDAGDILLEV